ncbi:MAG: TIGR02452 family protein [Atopobiaceae bacterium]|nr:TIGR02452 family protein [Atopobiaceae bacterium]
MAQDKRDNGRNNDRRAERTAAAVKHIAEMDAKYGRDVERSVAELKVYDGMPKPQVEGALPTIAIVDQDSAAAVLERGRGLASACDLALLDFASFVNPGGGYERGAWAQEEAICSESTLYNVLRTQKSWYGQNRSRNINCELYRNRGLVVPKVRFEREGYHSYADVIVVAAPNAVRARQNYRIDDDTLVKAMRDRIRFVLAIADELGHDKLVLGAFGCGAFGWDAAVVAELFRAELATGAHVATQVTFAIPKARFDENLPKFQHAFAAFPAKNDEPYRKPAAEPRRVERVEEDDEDEEDWRKYLG